MPATVYLVLHSGFLHEDTSSSLSFDKCAKSESKTVERQVAVRCNASALQVPKDAKVHCMLSVSKNSSKNAKGIHSFNGVFEVYSECLVFNGCRYVTKSTVAQDILLSSERFLVIITCSKTVQKTESIIGVSTDILKTKRVVL